MVQQWPAVRETALGEFLRPWLLPHVPQRQCRLHSQWCSGPIRTDRSRSTSPERLFLCAQRLETCHLGGFLFFATRLALIRGQPTAWALRYPCGDDVHDGDFGLYLGRHDGGYVVALQAIFPADIIGYERFATLPELKASWELD